MRALMARLPDGDDLADRAAPGRRARGVHRGGGRAQAGPAPIAADPAAGHAADILRMLRGSHAERRRGRGARRLSGHRQRPRPERLDLRRPRGGLDPRRPDLGGLGRHQRPEGPAARRRARPGIDMLDAIGEPANARAWLEAALDRGDRLMGFGHRVYRVRDPRADALKTAVAPA